TLLTLSLFTAPLCADDFWYATFWRGGLPSFLALSAEHYQTFNGRALVHAAAQSALALGVPFCACCLLALLLAAAACAPRLTDADPLPAAAAFFLLLLTLPAALLREGLLWISAAFNYLLPTALAVAVLGLNRLWTEDRLPLPARLLLPLAFVAAGATTEQMGLALTATLAVTGLALWLTRRTSRFRALLPALLTAAGAATVFLSPATLKRAAEATAAAPLQENLAPFARLLAGRDGILPHLALAAFVLALASLRDRTLPRLLLTGLAAAPLALLLAAPAPLPAVLLLLAVLTADGLALLSGGHPWSGALCLLAAATALVMLPTGVFEPRVTLPPALLACLLTACHWRRALPDTAPRAETALLLSALLLSTACFAPTLRSCLANARLTAENNAAIAAARTTGRLTYDFGYDRRSCHALVTDDGFFYRTFLAYHGLEACEVTLVADGMAPLYTGDGRRLPSPAYREGGREFFPLRDIVEALGGSVTPEDGQTVFRLGRHWAVLRGDFLYC
ncbi:MAG: hypothetical protein IJF59_03605, partial [Clostridia bacterium]|nr:hypothetical protein [Clostridia bacterium]